MAAVAGSALAFVAYRMYSESNTKPAAVLEKTKALKDTKSFVMNSDAENISHVQETKGLYGLASWIVHYNDGTQSAKLYTPPTEIKTSVGPLKQARAKSMENVRTPTETASQSKANQERIRRDYAPKHTSFVNSNSGAPSAREILAKLGTKRTSGFSQSNGSPLRKI